MGTFLISVFHPVSPVAAFEDVIADAPRDGRTTPARRYTACPPNTSGLQHTAAQRIILYYSYDTGLGQGARIAVDPLDLGEAVVHRFVGVEGVIGRDRITRGFGEVGSRPITPKPYIRWRDRSPATHRF